METSMLRLRKLLVQWLLLLQVLLTTRMGQGFSPPSPARSFDHSTVPLCLSSKDDDVVLNPSPFSTALSSLTVGVIGGGPAGLLLSHYLTGLGASVQVFEQRPPVQQQTDRAYALGIGIRGRTAIQGAQSALWDALKTVGYSSERFLLHVGPFSIKLRDTSDSTSEPSLLLFQSDLCSVLAEELQKSPLAQVVYGCKITSLNVASNTIRSDTSTQQSFDLIVGADGVNSIVRTAMEEYNDLFVSHKETLPGTFKVATMTLPPQLDATAVQLLFPKSGSTTAFLEPTGDNQCCLLLAGNNETDTLLYGTDETIIAQELEDRFPKLVGANLDAVAAQLVSNKVGQASSVTCNTYHMENICLIGDACHATGGVSGQGVNSALQDAANLANALHTHYDGSNDSLSRALLSYSQKAVSEGKALYDLSFGPKPSGTLAKLRFGLKNFRDFLFQGKLGIGELPLQTLLTTSLNSFADVRRNRNKYYVDDFPAQEAWNDQIEELHNAISSREVVNN